MNQRISQDTIIYYDRVSDLYKDLGLPIEQDAEFTINSLLNIHKDIPYKSPVFRANYYSFIFIKEGQGNYTTDEQTFEYDSRTIYFTNPGHIKAFEFYQLSDAFLITLSEGFLKTNVHKDVFDEFPFLLAETVPPQTLSAQKFEEFERLYLQIFSEYQADSLYKYRIIGNLFVALLLKIKAQFWANLHLLFWLSLFPFVTGWMGENYFEQNPIALYGIVLFMAALAYKLLYLAIISNEDENSAVKIAMGKDSKGTISIFFYLTGKLISFFKPVISLCFYILVAILWFIPDGRIEKMLT